MFNRFGKPALTFNAGNYYLIHQGYGLMLVKALFTPSFGQGYVFQLLTVPNCKGMFKEEPVTVACMAFGTCSLFYKPDVKVEFFNLDCLPKSEYPESCLE